MTDRFQIRAWPDGILQLEDLECPNEFERILITARPGSRLGHVLPLLVAGANYLLAAPIALCAAGLSLSISLEGVITRTRSAHPDLAADLRDAIATTNRLIQELQIMHNQLGLDVDCAAAQDAIARWTATLDALADSSAVAPRLGGAKAGLRETPPSPTPSPVGLRLPIRYKHGILLDAAGAKIADLTWPGPVHPDGSPISAAEANAASNLRDARGNLIALAVNNFTHLVNRRRILLDALLQCGALTTNALARPRDPAADELDLKEILAIAGSLARFPAGECPISFNAAYRIPDPRGDAEGAQAITLSGRELAALVHATYVGDIPVVDDAGTPPDKEPAGDA